MKKLEELDFDFASQNLNKCLNEKGLNVKKLYLELAISKLQSAIIIGDYINNFLIRKIRIQSIILHLVKMYQSNYFDIKEIQKIINLI